MALSHQLRENMIQRQMRPAHVNDPRVLEAFRAVPRETFLPASLHGIAYSDEEIEVSAGRKLVKPTVLARLIQAAEIKPDDKVLNIACRLGYSSALLSRLAAHVVSTEQDDRLVKEAENHFKKLGIKNAPVFYIPLTDGYKKGSPYDVIFIGGAVTHIPKGILGQLANHGRLVTIVASERSRGAGSATLFIRTGDTVSRRSLFEANASFLPGFGPQKEVFEF